MKKLFVSVPMNGRNEKDIKADIAKMHKFLEEQEGEPLQLIDSYIEENAPEGVNKGVWYLAKSLEKLAEADIFVGIETDNTEVTGCAIESLVAGYYNIKRFLIK
jgi:hypothetical protein